MLDQFGVQQEAWQAPLQNLFETQKDLFLAQITWFE